ASRRLQACLVGAEADLREAERALSIRYASATRSYAHRDRRYAGGKRASRRAPPCGDRSARTVPPCCSAMRRTRARPSPAPPPSRDRLDDRRVNRSKTRRRSASGIPGPSSSTRNMAAPPSSSVETTTREAAYLAALSSRLRTRWLRLLRSPRTLTP